MLKHTNSHLLTMYSSGENNYQNIYKDINHTLILITMSIRATNVYAG